ncbi:MAG: PAS domain-containing protein [Gammaproteobacteria bacterium]|nr:PAS domain-containing protein [Gammaproteobacteria bacterium]
MKLLSSIKYQILAVLSLLLAIQVLYLITYIFNVERNDIERSVHQDLKNISVNLQNSIEFLMRNSHFDQVKVKISELGVNSNIRYALLTDQNQNIFASTKLSHIGKNLSALSLGLVNDDNSHLKDDVLSSSERAEGNVWTSANKDVVLAVYPVAAFHQSSDVSLSKTGTLIVAHDLSRSVNEAYGVVIRVISIQIVSVIILAVLINVLVFRRISLIREQTEKISQGHYRVHIPVVGRNELSLLSRDIESMAVQVDELLGTVFRSEETFAKAQEIAHIGSWDWDITSGGLAWSDEIYRIFGLKPQEFGATYEAFLNSVHPEDQRMVVDAVNEAVENEHKSYFVEHRVAHPDGVIRDVQEQGKVYRDDNGNPLRMIGTVLDVTERKIIEQALTDERNFINAVLDSAGALVLVLDREGKIVRFNNACEILSGYSFDEIKNKFPWDTVLPRQDAPRIYQDAFKSLLDNPVKEVVFYTNYWVDKTGVEYLIEWANSLLFDENGDVEYVVSTGIDITEKNKALEDIKQYRDNLEEQVKIRTQELEQAQDELIRNERLATLGQLTATVSHELRNPLGAMAPSIYVVKKLSDPEDEKLQQAISRIGRNIERCDRIIDELLDFTRLDKLMLRAVEIDDWLSSVINEQTIIDGISIETQYCLKGISVMMDTEVFRRAVINVFDNACQAMLDESDGNRAKLNSLLSIKTAVSENRVDLVFSDNGSGMSDEVKAKIFEPLFSTKGFGVGLGMPTIKRIMEQHHGGIDIESKEGRGTVLTLWLPHTGDMK